MKRRLENILVTGRAGFIGSNFIHFIFSKTKFKGRIIMEKLQYIKRSREIRQEEGMPLQIAFITSADARDRRSWSGGLYYMGKALERHCGQVHYLGPADSAWFTYGKMVGRITSLFIRKLLGKRYDYSHSYRLSKALGKFFSKKLKQGEYDLVFAPLASSEIAFLETSLPIVYLSDTTFANVLDYYSGFSNLTKMSIKQGYDVEGKAIRKSAIALYTSEWASRSVIQDCWTDPSAVHVIPLGANIDVSPSFETVLSKKKTNRCRLLFIGVDWKRKGGDIAIDAFLYLNKMGIDTELTILGCAPPREVRHEKMKVIPFLNKNIPEQQRRFYDILFNSDFLLLPTRAECMGFVFCEASAFGLPSITTDTGGVSSVVIDGKNGFLLPYKARGEEYAKIIAEIFSNDEKYYSLVQSSRKMYDEKLNWDTWGLRVKRILHEKLQIKN